MVLSLPAGLNCYVRLTSCSGAGTIFMSFTQEGRFIAEYTLTHDTYPDLRYLLILYFYNESIPVDGKAPHPISLREYSEIYEAMFGIKCVYTDKNSSMDHFRSHDIYQRILKNCGLKFVRGGLCQFNRGVPDVSTRNLFRQDLLKYFLAEIERTDISQKAKNTLIDRYNVLRGYMYECPAKYLHVQDLIEQQFILNETQYTLYSYQYPIDWNELLEKHRHIIIQGICGSGKSTLLNSIAVNPYVHRKYNVNMIRLVTQTHIFTRKEAENIEKYTGIIHLYLLDGFNELPSNDNSRPRILNEINELMRFPNVRIILTSTGATGLWPEFVNAVLGNISVESWRMTSNSAMMETPLIYNAYSSAPKTIQKTIKNEYQALEYATRIKLASIMNRANKSDILITNVAYYVLMPMLAHMLCLNDSLRFSDCEVHRLFELIKNYGTEENAMMRLCFSSVGLLLPNISEWTKEQYQNAFGLLLEQGEIVIAKKYYMFKHQRTRDYYAVSYAIKKLSAIMDDVPNTFIYPQLNLSSSAMELMRQALGLPNEKMIFQDKSVLLSKIISTVVNVKSSEQLTATNIKLAYTCAQAYEYIIPHKLKYDSRKLQSVFVELMSRVTNWVCEYPEIAKTILAQMDESSITDMLAMIMCKHAELSINNIHEYSDSYPSPYKRINNCLRIVEAGRIVLGQYPRLMHSKAKAFLYLNDFKYIDGKNEEANELLDQSISLLEYCFSRGSFLSGNLLAFMHRTPVTCLLESKPDIRDYVRSLAINIKIAVDPSLHGLAPTYARNEAIDALLMGEVSIRVFPGLSAFAQLIYTPEGASRVIEPGNGTCGKKELKLVRALLGARGGTLGDTRPFTVFYEFIADKYEYELYGRNDETGDSLAARHMPRLQARLAFNGPDGLLDHLALISLTTDLRKALEYIDALTCEIKSLNSSLYVLADSQIDPTGSDIDHPYYSCRRYLYYHHILSQDIRDNECLGAVAKLACEVRDTMSKFEETHPCMKVSQSFIL